MDTGSSNVSKEAPDPPADRDTLFLVSRLLKAIPSLSGTYASLEKELNEGKLLGQVQEWTGDSRDATLSDLERKHETIPSDQLSTLLHSFSRSTMVNSTMDNHSSSMQERNILLPTRGVYNDNDANQHSDAQRLTSALISNLISLRSHHDSIQKNDQRVVELKALLQEKEKKEENGDDGHGEKDSDTGVINNNEEKMDIPANEEDVVILDNKESAALRQTLTVLGAGKEIRKLEEDTKALHIKADHCITSISSYRTSLSTLGALRDSFKSGHVRHTPQWILGRSLGLTSLGNSGANITGSTGGGRGISNSCISGNRSFKGSVLSKYKHLYTVSGHMHNPAYCCTFDKTGSYMISGADDYNVKIWDARRGLLIRTCRGHQGYITYVTISPDNALIASACTRGMIRLWRLRDGVCVAVMQHGSSIDIEVTWLQFEASTCTLASSGSDGMCIVWDLTRYLRVYSDIGTEEDNDNNTEDNSMEKEEYPLLRAATSAREELFPASKLILIQPTPLQTVDSQESPARALAPLPVGTDNGEGGVGGVIQVSPSSNEANGALLTNNADNDVNSSSNQDVSALNAVIHQSSTNTMGLLSYGPSSLPLTDLNTKAFGLFSWSRSRADNPQGPGKLTLPHIQDIHADYIPVNHETAAEDDTIKVTCLDICPVGGALVTGCEDGVARVWKYDDNLASQVDLLAQQESLETEDDMNNDSSGISKRTRASENTKVERLRELLSPEELHRLEPVLQYLVLRLEGHSSGVSDVKFSNCGDRVVTGSLQDGTVRVWTFADKYTSCEHIVLSLKEGDRERLPSLLSSSRSGNSRGQNRRQTRHNAKTLAYNVCWSCDDSKILTLQNVIMSENTRLKVWDSFTGDLLRIIMNIGDRPTKQLQAHPVDPSMCATGGEDGCLCVWDVGREKLLMRHNLGASVESDVSVADISFSPDGFYISTSDTDGRVSLFGLDRPSNYEEALSYPEQVYSTDYMEFLLDNEGFAIDQGTQLPVHESPLGDLCRMDMTAYAEQPCINEFPLHLDDRLLQCHLHRISSISNGLAKLMQSSYSFFYKCKRKGREKREYKPLFADHAQSSDKDGIARGPRGNNAGNTDNGSNNNRGSNIHTLNNFNNDSNRRWQIVDGSDMLGTYEPSSGDEYDSDYDFGRDNGVALTDVWRSAADRATRRQNNQRSERSRSRGRRIVESDDEEDGRNSRSQNNGSRARQQRRNRRNRYIDYDEDREEVSDTASSESMVEMLYDSDEERNRDARRVRRAAAAERRQQRATANSSSSRQRASNGNGNGARRARPKVYRSINWTDEYVPLDVEVDGHWLSIDTQQSSYVPQLGDDVIYFPQGHQLLLAVFSELERPPWLGFPGKWPLVRCNIRDISYKFPKAEAYHQSTSALAVVHLVVTGYPNRHKILNTGNYVVDFVEPRSTRNQAASEIHFTVSLRDYELPDFLVLEHTFTKSTLLPWHQGIRVDVSYNVHDEAGELKKENYRAKVLRLSNDSDEWPHSPWEALEVEWDHNIANSTTGNDATSNNGSSHDNQDTNSMIAVAGSSMAESSMSPIRDLDRISPWEAIPVLDSSSSYTRTLANHNVQAPLLSQGLCSAIDESIGSLLTSTASEVCDAFTYEVDSTSFPDYYCIVPHPMYLDLIRRRLTKGYYRQLPSLMHDINLIYSNCIRYNQPDADISKGAYLLVNGLQQLVNGCVSRDASNNSSSAGDGEVVAVEDEEEILRRVSLSMSQPDTAGAISHSQEGGEGNISPHTLVGYGAIDATGNDDAGIEEEDSVTVSRKRRSRHRSGVTEESPEELGKATKDDEIEEEEEDDEDEAEEEEEEAEDSEELADSDDSGSPAPKRSRRGRASRANQSTRKATRRGVRNNAKQSTSAPAAASTGRRSARAAVSYHVPDSDEEFADYGYDEEKEVTEAISQSKRNRKKRGSKSNGTTTSNGASNGASNGTSTSNKKSSNGNADVDIGTLLQTFTFEVNDLVELESRGCVRVDSSLKKDMFSLLHEAEAADDTYGIFAEPITENTVPGYSLVVAYPMDLSTVRGRLENRLYASINELRNDLVLIYDNCEFYNEEGSVLYQESRRQRAITTKKVEALLDAA